MFFANPESETNSNTSKDYSENIYNLNFADFKKAYTVAPLAMNIFF